MAFVPGFENDLFISYAHNDNEPSLSGEQWVSEFVRLLERALKQLLGDRQDLTIFYDNRRLQSNHELERLRKEVRQTAVFISVCSPSYASGEWTRAELETFVEIMDDDERLFAVEYLPLNEGETHPPPLDKRVPISWHKARGETGVRIPVFPKRDAESYEQLLLDLAVQIKNQLLKMSKSSQREVIASAMPATTLSGVDIDQSLRKVLLAQPTDDLEEDLNRVRVRQHLEQFGIDVYPKRSYPTDGDAFRAAVEADLEVCDVFVQLVTKTPARVLPDLPSGYSLSQYELARAAADDAANADRKIKILQWWSPEVDLSGFKVDLGELCEAALDVERQARLAQHLKLLNSPDLVVTSLQTFKDSVVDACQPVEKPKPAPAPGEETGPPEVFVKADPEDEDVAAVIFEALSDAGVDVIVYMDDEDDPDAAATIQERYEHSDGIFIIYGHADQKSVLGHINRLKKILPGRDKPPLVAFFDAPPPPPEKKKFMISLRGWEQVDCRDGLDPAMLHSIMSELKH